MSKLVRNTEIVRCSCGSVEVEVTGAPITCASCHCSDCHEGSRQLEALPNAPSILDSHGGTSYVLFSEGNRQKLKAGSYFQKYPQAWLDFEKGAPFLNQQVAAVNSYLDGQGLWKAVCGFQSSDCSHPYFTQILPGMPRWKSKHRF